MVVQFLNSFKLQKNILTRSSSPIQKLLEPVEKIREIKLTGLTGALGAIVLASIARQARLSIFLTFSVDRAREVADSVRFWLGNQKNRVFCFLPERESVYDHTATDPQIIYERLAAISRTGTGKLVVIPAEILLQRFYSPEKWQEKSLCLNSQADMQRDELLNRLVELGYQRVSLVEEPGTFAVRGALIDVFPPALENPVRLDFFGDELESIKEFSAISQRSIDVKKRVFIGPASECVIDDNELEEIVDSVSGIMPGLSERKTAMLERKIEHLASHGDQRDVEELKPFVKIAHGNFFQFFDDFELIVEDFDVVFSVFDEISARFDKKFQQVFDVTPLLRPKAYYHEPDQVKKELAEHKIIEFSRFGKLESAIAFAVEPHPLPTDPSRDSFLKEIRAMLSDNWAVIVVINDEYRFNNLKGLLSERKIRMHSAFSPMSVKYGYVSIFRGAAGRGFKDSNSRVAVFTEEDVYQGKVREQGKRRYATQQDILAISQMVPGDIVVHADHGVAEFRGIKTMTAAGNTREYMLLKYAGNDRLYVPTDQVNKVSKYIGMEGFTPRIHSLDSKSWSNQKRRVSKNVEAVARELLELYAKRQDADGFAFSPDCELQQQMEEKFPFVETPDQMRAIEETKKDMESNAPMDRLICGDVGYGKTEVAMRAAFKAVCSGKQVAVLAPTTLLAFQHFQTFSERFSGMPVSVDMVSRLRKPAEQKETMKKLRAGTLDVLIGTHRLLSKDFSFSRLGLLIVDEEQRFGVKHKERLKQLKSQIDVLTLTATPIPRTMQMSLSGIRQISIIDTAPTDRKPVQTYVAPFDQGWIKRAIIDELKRGGQIYYVFNRVEKIEQKAAFLQQLVPEARIMIAHGQMPEQKVERNMLDFVNRKYDLLLSTTIIESGLDIPNVNTLIVDQAQMLGLSQMYQLRGRVGRSSRQAWAYFFYATGKKLTKEAMERLETIEEHTALGSGFKIALRDLQIRGAGNILGEAQSGHISSIGFALYMEMLEEAVAGLKAGRPVARRVETAIEIPVTAFFPRSYIADEETRVELYRRLARCADSAMLAAAKEECLDRFGKLPEVSEALFAICRLRILGAEVGVQKITRVINHLRFEFVSGCLPDISLLLQSDQDLVSKIYLNPKDVCALNLNINSDDVEDIFLEAETLLNLLIDCKLKATTQSLERNND
jgi:transcription-repair coupling factor (superfamily II helicase)